MKIETAVDNIMDLVKENKKISIKKISKKLKLGTKAIEEWAKTLEEEGLIIIQYKFGGPYLVEKKISGDEQEQIIKKIDQQRDFHMEDESSLIDDHAMNMETSNEGFKKIKQELEQELNELRNDIKNLEGGDGIEVKKFLIKELNTMNKRLNDEDKKMEKTITWINFFKSKSDEQDQKIKKLEKSVKK